MIEKAALPLALGAFGLLAILERRRPLRERVEPKAMRAFRNFAVASAAGAAMYLIERPIAAKATGLVERRRFGLLKIMKLPPWLESLAAVVLLDYTLYLWHVFTHRLPGLWRFHVVHHADLDLDTTTALRFHFGEIVISVAWRAVQILAIGVSPRSLRIWQALLLPSVMFHHSNLRIPAWLERPLSRIVVTPRLHGIHHSIVQAETDSNWSSGLSVWDRLHGTFRDISEHDGVVIGVPAFRRQSDLKLIPLIEMPFREQRPTWKLRAGEDSDGH